MAIPDISGLDESDLITLMQQANQLYAQKQAANASDAAARRQSIANAIATLDTLLGPADAAKGTTSIRAIRQYTGAEMVTGAATALPLIFQALEILTTTQLDIAHVEALDQGAQ